MNKKEFFTGERVSMAADLNGQEKAGLSPEVVIPPIIGTLVKVNPTPMGDGTIESYYIDGDIRFSLMGVD